ncbi:hypothetical protein Q5P01_021655 [Channa striata]|uniref:Fibronectin type-III domain-containing protein n=1 Tax=Channa striata TaxID=64152 RepID=A0AA88RYN0_CHASR|nr:hypothetical protein Q5P01_021655 [Channa striata]
MASSGFYPAFHVLLWLHAALAFVEPPTNVTLQCHNLQNVLKWTYDQHTPGLRFKVKIHRYDGTPYEHLVESPHVEMDLSFLNDPNNQYWLQLFAVIGQNESEAAPEDGISFSYFKDSLVDQKCSVDLPPVNVTAKPDAFIQFSFLHPWLVYKTKLPSRQNPKHRLKKSHESLTDKRLPEFTYDVVIDDQAPHEFTCEEKVCEKILPVNASQEQHCLTITGELQKMTVKTTQPFCTQLVAEPEKSYNVVSIVSCVVAAVVAAAFVIIMLYRKNTKPSTSLPDTIKKIKSKTQKHQTLGTERVHISVPEVEPTTPTPLLWQETVDFPCDTTPSPETDLRLPVRGVTEEEIMVAPMEREPNNDGSAYMEGLGLEEEEMANSNDASSGYEKREAVSVDLGPDDRAEGYRG